MDVFDMLASASGQKKQEQNIALAAEIAAKADRNAVEQLVEGLTHKKKAIRHDCIKVLYEIAEIDPDLISPFVSSFIDLLVQKDNRMQWGAMTALSAITEKVPAFLFDNITIILAASDNGSVITRDHCVRILVKLAQYKAYEKAIIPLLLEQVAAAPDNQFPSYAEQALPVAGVAEPDRFRGLLEMRVGSVEPESKRKRVEKVLKKLK